MVQKPFTFYILHFTIIFYYILPYYHPPSAGCVWAEFSNVVLFLYVYTLSYAFTYFHILLIAMLPLPHPISTQLISSHLNGLRYTLLSILERPRYLYLFLRSSNSSSRIHISKIAITKSQRNENSQPPTKWRIHGFPLFWIRSLSLSVMYSDGGVAMAAVVTFNVDCMELRRFLKIYFKTASFSLVLKFARVLLI